MRRKRRLLMAEPSRETAGLIERIGRIALPLEGPRDLDPLLERIGDAHYVLLGEASHGTSDYYRWRAWISQRLIREKGFSFIAVEGDWPDCYRVNRYVKGFPDSGPDAREVLRRLRPMADLDVGQRGGRRPGRVAPPAQCRAAGRPEGRLLRAGRVQPVGVAVRGARLPPQGRPLGAAGGPARVPVLRALRRGRPGVRAGHGHGAGLLRGRGRRPARGAAPRASRGTATTAARSSSPPSRTPWSSRTPRPTTGPWSAAVPNPGTSATGT